VMSFSRSWRCNASVLPSLSRHIQDTPDAALRQKGPWLYDESRRRDPGATRKQFQSTSALMQQKTQLVIQCIISASFDQAKASFVTA
jgi:hypothetical protein